MHVRTAFFFIASAIGLHAWPQNLLFAQDVQSDAVTAKPKDVEWLTGEGRDLRMRLRGAIVDQEGHPQADCTIQCVLESAHVEQSLSVDKVGNTFETWIPVNTADWYRFSINVSTEDGRLQAVKTLSCAQFRSAAIDGLTLVVEPATRLVEIAAVFDGKPAPGATVRMRTKNSLHEQATGPDAVARFSLLPRDQLLSVMAWTNDYKVGGYSFFSKPQRDAASNNHEIQLHTCRDQRIRLTDIDGKPAAGVEFRLNIATPQPEVNYIGINDNSKLVTDNNGEAVYKWFPDWPDHFFYLEVASTDCYLDGKESMRDGVIAGTVKPFQVKRKTITGKVTSQDSDVGGIYVQLATFQDERPNRLDWVRAFTDEKGQFSVDVLPDAKYCAQVSDAILVSPLIDLIPYDSNADSVNAPTFEVQTGERVELTVTSGPECKPVPFQSISLRTEHEFSWIEDGEEKFGRLGRDWYVETDEHGKASTHALPGAITASIYSPTWQSQKEVTIETGKFNAIEFHENVSAERVVSGQLTLDAGLDAELANAELIVDSLDPEHKESQKFIAADDGSFEFKTQYVGLLLFAATKDGKAAGLIKVEKVDQEIVFQLEPTSDFHGQLLGDDDKPLVGHVVDATLTLPRERGAHPEVQPWRLPRNIQATTDEQGNYTLPDVPCGLVVEFQVRAPDGIRLNRYFSPAFLTPGESRPRDVSRRSKPQTPVSERLWSDRFETARKDCELGGFHLMVIVSSGEDSAKFVNDHFYDYQKNPDVAAFIQLKIDAPTDKQRPEDLEFLKQKSLELPAANKIFAYTFDSAGNELGRTQMDLQDAEAATTAAEFVAQNRPAKIDAKEKWDKAFEEAQRSNRKVWVRISQRYCGPCFLLSRWLDEHEELLSKDYVMLKVDDSADEHGSEFADRVTRGAFFGIPFHAIFDEDQVLRVDSDSPVGNIGFPSGYEGKKHLRKMLMETRTRLTDEEIEQMIATLED